MNTNFMVGLLACIVLTTSAGELIRPASDSELESLVGEVLPHSIKSVKWKADEPPRTNLIVYAVTPATYRQEFLQSLANWLEVRGEINRMPTTMLDAPGYWVKEPNPTNHLRWQSVWFSEKSGAVGYASGEDNHKWDVKNHKPMAQGVPDEREALAKTLAMLPALGITTNDLEHLPDGKLRCSFNTEGTWYNDRNDNWARKRYIRQVNVELWQKIHDGASVLSLGGGGMLRAGYISGGRLGEVEMTFRKIKPVATALPRTRKEVIAMLKKGQARSFRGGVPDDLTIAECALVYPQANSMTKQDYLWPFYSLKAESVEAGGETNVFFIYVPLAVDGK